MHRIVAGAPNPLMRWGAGVCDFSSRFCCVWISSLTKSGKRGLLGLDTKKKQRGLLHQLDPVIVPLERNIGLP